MKAAIITPGRDVSGILKHLEKIDPEFKPEVWPDIEDPGQITAALIWKAPDEVLEKFSNLKFVSSFGAGVDHLIFNSSIPQSVLITRLVDPKLTGNVVKYCIMSIFSYEKNLRDHILNKEIKKWEWKEDKPEPVIGIMGMGVIGKEIAKKLMLFEYTVNGYSLSHKELEGINHFAGIGNLQYFLNASDVVVNVMPLTNLTQAFFNEEFFRQCKPGTYFINLGRGQQVVDNDLLQAIGLGIISGATLDVFNEEPLPPDHPFWESKQITITPHIAGLTAPKSAATQFYENFKRFLNDRPLINLVNRSKGY